MKEITSKITLNKNLKGNYWQLKLATGWKNYTPGQFVMIEVPSSDVFLRRPFCIASLEGGIAEICYKAVGRGTKILTGLKMGDRLNVLGPLGKGFSITTDKKAPKILVAGGYGIASLLGLAKIVKGNLALFYGVKKAADLLYLSEFKKLGVKIFISTEDGSVGVKGVVTGALQKYLTGAGGSNAEIYACGPTGMLNSVAGLAKKTKITNCQLSLESYMACGIGVCSGCAVEDSKGNFVRACKEGPAFRLENLGGL